MTQTKTLIVKGNGEKEFFDAEKLESSLVRSGASPETINEIVAHIGELKDGMSTSQIYKHAHFLLIKIEKKAASRYSLRRAVMDLGPSGFPFENFIGEIMREKGFTVETDKIVMGECVAHEIDVIAYNENKLIMMEAKFHNELGIKSDLKVALYVKARFDDLKEKKYFYGKERNLDEGWLITNTKFTSTAIQYGVCCGLKMVGWNYPLKGNLQDMIEDGDLHPITCLTNLGQHHTNELFGRGVVLCKTILENTDILKDVGLKDFEISKIQEEISNL
ncbi:MAG: restriction endonuclease [Parcubacteria group bacterium]|nr:restriction endonuclease [Parcubacteria group bacterium]